MRMAGLEIEQELLRDCQKDDIAVPIPWRISMNRSQDRDTHEPNRAGADIVIRRRAKRVKPPYQAITTGATRRLD